MKYINNFRNRFLFAACVCIVLLQACRKDDFLEVPNTGAVTSETAFSTEQAADLVLNDVYNNLPDMYGDNCFDAFENWSDNSLSGFNWTKTCNEIRNKKDLNANFDFNYGWDAISKWLPWGQIYGRIRKCNLYIAGVQSASALSQDYKDKRIGEARTLRAYFYQQLWTMYGGVPIITEPDSRADGDAIFHARATTDETFKFIDDELAAAAQLLKPNNGNDGGGRVNQGTALTLKGWVELFHASPLNNPSNDVTRWANAAATNKQVMSMGYSLYPNYGGLFLTSGNTNNEGIFYRQYIGGVKGSKLAGRQGPSYVTRYDGSKLLYTWISWGGSSATQELVDDYAMANGKAITDAGSGYDDTKPYINREPRFYQSILFNGNTLGGTFFSYVGSSAGDGSNEIDLSDSKDQTNTGYCVKKRMDTTVDITREGYSSQNYYYFRYADVLLNYAEAQNEAVGPDASVYAALDQIRDRAGLPNFTTVYPGVSKDAMRTLIRRERRIELAFEDKRYPDLLRWKTAEVNLNHVMHGMKATVIDPTKSLTQDNFKYERIEAVPSGAPQWTFDAAKNYLLPIPLSAIGQNKALQDHQNPGY